MLIHSASRVLVAASLALLGFQSVYAGKELAIITGEITVNEHGNRNGIVTVRSPKGDINLFYQFGKFKIDGATSFDRGDKVTAVYRPEKADYDGVLVSITVNPVSTGASTDPVRIGVVQDTSVIGGCSCYFSPVSTDQRIGSNGYIFFADYAGKARMNINGRDVELREVGREQAKGELGRCLKKRCKYTASGINATVDYRETNKCPPEPTECEVTGYDVTITVEKGGHIQTVMGKGECGC